jgi:hypothetical protein
LPRIPDYLLDSVLYLYPSEAAAEDGVNLGGSGFLYGESLGYGKYLLFVVTNKHVVERGNMIARLNTLDGETDIIAFDAATWYPHPDGDDLIVTPIGLNRERHKYHFIYGEGITEGKIRSWDIGPGDDVFFVGRFVNHEGKQRNLPSVRFGNISQMPWEPVRQDDGFDQQCFLVEGRSIPGYSGCPVFIIIPPTPEDLYTADRKQSFRQNPRSKKVPIYIGPIFMGIDCFHILSRQKIMLDGSSRPVNENWYVASNTGMMGVIPAWKLKEMFKMPPLSGIIDKMQARVKSDASASPAAKVASDDTGTPTKPYIPEQR